MRFPFPTRLDGPCILVGKERRKKYPFSCSLKIVYPDIFVVRDSYSKRRNNLLHCPPLLFSYRSRGKVFIFCFCSCSCSRFVSVCVPDLWIPSSVCENETGTSCEHHPRLPRFMQEDGNRRRKVKMQK